MAITAFKKELWEGALLREYEGITVAGLICQAPKSLDGKTYNWSKATLSAGLKDYTGVVDWESVNTEDIPCNFDQKKYFAFAVDDCDAVQLAGDVMLPLVKKEAYDIKKHVDTVVFAEMAKNAGTKIGTTSAKKEITTPEQAYDFVVDMNTKLDEKDAPEFGRYLIASPSFINLLAKDKRVLDNATVLANGIVQGMVVNGIQVVKSNNLPANQILAVVQGSHGLGKQIDKTEAMRLQGSFADGIRGLVQFGHVTLEAKGIVSLFYNIA